MAKEAADGEAELERDRTNALFCRVIVAGGMEENGEGHWEVLTLPDGNSMIDAVFTGRGWFRVWRSRRPSLGTFAAQLEVRGFA